MKLLGRALKVPLGLFALARAAAKHLSICHEVCASSELGAWGRTFERAGGRTWISGISNGHIY